MHLPFTVEIKLGSARLPFLVPSIYSTPTPTPQVSGTLGPHTRPASRPRPDYCMHAYWSLGPTPGRTLMNAYMLTPAACLLVDKLLSSNQPWNLVRLFEWSGHVISPHPSHVILVRVIDRVHRHSP